MLKFCGCGSLLKDDGSCSNKRCTNTEVKRKGWFIDGCFVDYGKPVTYEQAVEDHRKMSEKMKNRFPYKFGGK